MSVSANMYEGHILDRIDVAEAKLDDILLAPPAKDQFARHGMINVNTQPLDLAEREIHVLKERYEDNWKVTVLSGALRFEPIRRGVNREKPSPAELRLQRRLDQAQDIIRELMAGSPQAEQRAEGFLKSQG